MKMKAMYSVALLVAMTVLLVISVPVHASKMDDRIANHLPKSRMCSRPTSITMILRSGLKMASSH